MSQELQQVGGPKSSGVQKFPNVMIILLLDKTEKADGHIPIDQCMCYKSITQSMASQTTL